MFSACISCRSDLRRNQSLLHLPVGRRIAYELAHGRLWVICHRCGDWNLTPLEDRWEALEECERLFSTAPARSTTDTIGLARIGRGTELLRIGPAASRSDIANWRYGKRLHRRRSWFLYGAAIITGVSLAVLTAIDFSFDNTLLAAWGAAILAVWIVSVHNYLSGKLLWLRLRLASPRAVIRPDDLPEIRLRRTGKRGHLAVILPGGKTDRVLLGTQAADLLAVVLPRLNRKGGTPEEIEAAIRLVEQSEASPQSAGTDTVPWERVLRGTKRIALLKIPTPERLALEMAVEEDRELRALHGRAIRHLPAWEKAEEVAAIADNLLSPEPIRQWLARVRSLKGKPSS